MIKRPFIVILLFYLFGVLLAWRISSILFLLPIILLQFPLIYLILNRIKNRLANASDVFLWCLPFFMMLGFLSMRGQLKLSEVDQLFQDKVSCEIDGAITMSVQKKSSKALYIKNVSIQIPGEETLRCEKVIVYCSTQGWVKPDPSLLTDYRVGNQIRVQGTLQKFQAASNPGQFNEKLYYKIENIDYKMQAKHITVLDGGYSVFHQGLEVMKQRLMDVYNEILSEKEAGTLIAMILGEKYLLDDDIKELYQINGISHVIAISGLHISLIGMFIFLILKKLRVPVVVRTLITIFCIYGYGVMTDFSVSTNRAVVMMTIMLLAAIFGKTYDMLSALSLSAFLILLQNPLQIMSAGFLLSFAAMLGIAIIYPALQTLHSTKNPLINGLYVSFSAQASTTPVVLYFYYQFPLYGLITNLIILPFVTFLTLTSIFAAIVGAIFLPLGVFLIGVSNYILKFYEWVCRLGEALPHHLITVGRPDGMRILLYIVILILFLLLSNRYKNKLFGVLPVLALVVILLPQGRSGFVVNMLDVGQGDGLVLESESGMTYLIDGGSSDIKDVGKYRILPFLLYRGIDVIDYAIVSHSDNDHISGLKELMNNRRIKINTLILPGITKKDEGYLGLEELARQKGVKISYINQGDYLLDGKLKLTCLHPKPDYIPTSSNAYSTVLSVTYGEFDLLLTGDLEKDGEVALTNLLMEGSGVDKVGDKEKNVGDDVGSLVQTDYDVLKLAHHGSKNSTSEEFLSVIKPELSLISCGKDNSYGHPHKEVLERLEQVGCKRLITYEQGAIVVRTDGESMEVMQYRGSD